MAISPRRKLAVGAAGLIVLAGSGGAYASTQKNSSTPPEPAAAQKAFLDDVAGRLHVSTDQLTQAIKGAAQDRVDAAVKAGRLTQAQADKIKQRIAQANGLPLVGGPGLGPGVLRLHRGFGGPGFGGPGFGRPGFGPFREFGVAAKYLGLTPQKLFSALRGGKSLADVASDQGKSVDGLKLALKAAETARLDAAVKAGKLTQAESTRIQQELDQRLDAMVNGTLPKLGFQRRPFWP
jgi:polyhydroxyalkanoate synthesis regulator phasin